MGLLSICTLPGCNQSANRDWGDIDQDAYLRFAIKAYENDFSYTGVRNQMPLFPWIQALIYSPDLSNDEFFEQGKRLNVVISIAGLAAIGAAFFLKFSKYYALYSILVISFLCFAIKAAWFQAEILYYLLFAFAFILSIESIRCPRWYKSIGLGMLFALTHYTKASATPALAIYTFSFALPLLCDLRSRVSPERMLKMAFAAFAPLLVFMVLLFPYFNESKERYGQYMYNVNSTFYVWYDSWHEAKAGTLAAGDHYSWPKMPAEEIPSFTKYMNEHSSAEILRRFTFGAERLYRNACENKDQLGLCIHVGSVSLLFIAAFFKIILRNRGRLGNKDIQIGLFAFAILLIYGLLIAWYAAIVAGQRIILLLLIPLFWSVGLALQAAPRINLPGTDLCLVRAVILVMLVVLASQVYESAMGRAALVIGGF